MYDKTRHRGIVFEIMDRGGPTDDREPYVEDAAAEITRSRSLCHKANMMDPADPASCMRVLEDLFQCKLDDVTILTPVYCDMGIRVKLGRKVFINDSVHLISGGGIEIQDGVLIGTEAEERPGGSAVRICRSHGCRSLVGEDAVHRPFQCRRENHGVFRLGQLQEPRRIRHSRS